MSTAVMSPTSVYDFGDMLYKNHGSSRSSTSSHQKVLRWGMDSSPRAVGSPLPHQTLSRRSSTPATISAGDVSIASIVNSVSTLLLDNIREQSEQAQQQSVGGQHRKLDRSQSEPARGANINTSRYKTELCRPYEENGSCKYGDKCQFAHGMHELRNLVRHPKYKTELCRTFHTIGFCPYGPRCHFIHNAEEARGRGASPPPQQLRPKPLSLCPTHLSGLDPSGSSSSSSSSTSLSHSPTTSCGSFFPEHDMLTLLSSSPPSSAASVNNAFSFAQDFSPLVHLGGHAMSSPPPSPVGSLCSSRQSPTPLPLETRLPVFNRLSSTLA